ncbi:MAG: hypothetical protein ABIP29_08465, partial [Candidatus Eisenbacteria bacterium]
MSLDTDLPPREAAPRGTAAWLDQLAGRTHPRVAACLSNGAYRVLVTDRGAGLSAFGEHALTRWTGDPLEDREGFFLALVDRASGAAGRPWSPAGGAMPVEFGPGAVEWRRMQDGLDARLTVAVHPTLPLEVRRLELRSDAPAGGRTIELAAAVEVVLHSRAADLSHPAFSRLFVQTEWAAAEGVLLARRRPRGADESFPWLGLALLEERAPEYESDRARFLGRVLDRARPRGLDAAEPWAGTVGNVLDPVLALRTRVRLPHGEPRSLTFVLASGADRAQVLRTIEQARAEGGE